MSVGALGAERAELNQDSILDILNRLRRYGWLSDHKTGFDLSGCLSALITAFKIDRNLNGICEALPYKKEKILLVDLLNAMVNLGYAGKPAKVRLADLDERLLPCLFIPKGEDDDTGGGMVVLEFNRKENGEIDKITVFDGKTEKIVTMLGNTFTPGTAYFFQQIEEKDVEAASDIMTATGFSWFRSLLERFKFIFIQVMVISIMLNIVSLAAPLFVMLVYDRVISAHSIETLYYFTGGVLIALAFEWALRQMRSRSVAWFGARLDNIVSNAIFEHLMFLPSVYTERATVASQIARLKAFETVRDFFTGSLFLLLLELPFTIIIIAAIFFIGGSMGWIPIIMGFIYLLLLMVMQPRVKAAMRLSARANSVRKQMNIETFEKMHALRANGLTSMWFNNFRDISGRASLAGFYSSFTAAIISSISHALFAITGVSAIMIGVNRIWAGEMTTGALIAVMILTWRVLSPIQTFCNSVPRFEQVKNAIAQVNRLMNIKQERKEVDSIVKLHNMKGGVSFVKTGLRYTKDKDPVFAGLSFNSEPGQLVAIAGSNGSGKSTILKLVNGLYRPQSGSIRIDGLDIRQFEPSELRARIAYVPQHPNFFQGTIADNLRFGRPLAEDEVLEDALKQVKAWDEISALPQGMNTFIGSNQANELSSNLLYKLNLARAYVKNAKLMLFDELPYAVLNSPTGTAFKESLQEWKGKKSIIMVTHREDFIKMADVVVFLRVEERPLVGTAEQIIKVLRTQNN